MTIVSAVALVAISGASTASAQRQPVEIDSCMYRIPASALKRVPVYLEASADSTSKAILPNADFFAQAVAFKIREMLGGSQTKLAEADSIVDWKSMSGQIIVTAHRYGSLSWQVPDWSRGADTLRHSSLRLLDRAIRETVAGGETVMMPDMSRDDSMSFSLALGSPTVTREGKIVPLKVRQATPVFSIATAWEEPVKLTKDPRIQYPEISRTIRSIGNVQLTYDVDKAGKAVMETAKELWPAGYQRPIGTQRSAYDAFLRAVFRGLPSAEFSPAVVGGCVVKQRVVQTFEFKIP